MARGKCYIGTSGWSYAHWANDRFYPRGLRQSDWLHFYGQYFPTVEVNMSFYRLPKADMLARWRQVTDAPFVFAIKLWRRITHEKRLKDSSSELAQVFEVMTALKTKRGPLLVQLPPSLPCDVQLLDRFLADVKRAAGKFRCRVAVEFRNTSWLCEPVSSTLDKYNAALCLADLPQCPITQPNNARFIYVRRHGPGGRYRGCYAQEHIEADAARIREWLAQGRDVYAYFNNDIEGYAVDNARQLADAVE